MIKCEVDRVRGRIAVLYLYYLLKNDVWEALNRKHEGYERFVGSLSAANQDFRYGMTKSYPGDSLYDFFGQLNSTAEQVSIPLTKSHTYPDTTCFTFDWALEMGLNALRYWLFVQTSTSFSALRRKAGQIAQKLGVPLGDILELYEHLFVGCALKELAR